MIPAAAALHSRLLAALDDEIDGAVRLRHELHRHPELSGAERWTAQRVADALGEPDAETVAGTGRLIRIGGDADGGRAIAVRAELDALPVTERSGAAFSSTSGAMHACGHDVHLAALSAVARAVHTVGAPRPLLAVLQPREETFPSGARDVVASRAFARHDVAAVLAVHVQPQLPAGKVVATPGAVNAASDEVRITVSGQGGHGGYPHTTRDPVLALAHVIVAVQHLISRRTDPTHAAVLSIGALRAGDAANIVPGEATARGTLRALLDEDQIALRKELRATVASIAEAYGCTGTVEICEGEPALVNDEVLTAGAASWLRRTGLYDPATFRSCGADDFAYYASVAPSLMMFLGVGAATAASLHHARFLPPDETVAQAARALLAGFIAALQVTP